MNIEAMLYDGIRYVGVLAPVPTAYVISISLQTNLKWNVVIAIVSALIIEVVGFGAVYMFAIFREYNQSKRKTDPAAPLPIVGGLVVVYLVSVILLTVVLDIRPDLSLYAPAVFPFLSVIGMALTALRFDHVQRLESIKDAKQERKSQLIASKSEPTPAKAEPVFLTCEICGATHGKSGNPIRTQAALNAHMKAHKSAGNGAKE